MSTINYSKYQEAFFYEVENGTSNLGLIARAGSGKTFSILEAIKRIPSNKSIIYLAFNKAIVDELKTKCSSPNVEIKTLHSAGFAALMSTFRCKLNNYKYHKFLSDSLFLLSKEINIDTPEEEVNQYKSRTLRLIDLGRVELASTSGELEDLALKHEIDICSDETEVALKLIQWGKSNCREIDFTDMIYLPIAKDLKVKKYDYVFVDEAQDLNNAQRSLMLEMLGANSRFIAVGDDRQAINGFCGADVESFKKLQQIPNTKLLPLSICYRCGKNIIKEAQKIVPSIESAENAIDGVVDYINDLSTVQAGDMILSRVTSPLVSVCMKFITNGISAYVKGREIGTNLVNLVKKTKTLELDIMFEVLNNELYKIALRLSKKNNISLEEAKDEYAYIALQDKIECIQNISFGCINTKELISKITTLFQDNSKGICCSTIHKSKGLEADNVFIIALDKLPLKRCMNVAWKREQEENLQYVAITRAKKALHYVDCDVKTLKVTKD